ncbi:TPA: HNH endonuclease [Vibrio parahaemolyticus]|uniref:HNH endonuclease n=1 Tax=Vibrio parahaemolyticus TaxID=670 RepID=UPI00215EFD1C|nr:HNH endonuclease [Vibrio parahaemolyticus]
MVCIICRKSKNDMSDEHVIPDSMKGFYHIYSVCKGCNSLLGDRVDSPLVNHKLTELYRFSREVAGKSGRIPNPFSGIFFQEGNQDTKFRVDVDDKNELRVKSLPTVNIKKNGDDIESIEVSLDSDDEHKIDGILEKLAKRHGLPANSIIAGDKKSVLSTEGIKGQWKIDTLKFKIGLLKIAYEFAVDTIDGYFDDPDAIDISTILKAANYKRAEEYVKIGNGLQPEVFEPYENYLDLSSEKHYLVLSPSQFGLICLVKLHDLFAVGVVLSSRNYLDNFSTIVGINDINKRTFNKMTLEEVVKQCHGPEHTRFGYYFDTEYEAYLAQQEINSPLFKYEGTEQAEIPLFDESGQKYPLLLHELLPSLKSEAKYDGDWFIQQYYFADTPKYHVKSVSTGKLYRVMAFEISNERVKKI